jgi:hypothetical protein
MNGPRGQAIHPLTSELFTKTVRWLVVLPVFAGNLEVSRPGLEPGT